MSKFRKSEPREVPALNTAALPDLIFTILFFFMIVTTMRPVSIMTQFEIPHATELQKLKEKSLVIYIMVGHKQGDTNEDIDIQLNSNFVTLDELFNQLEMIQKEIPTEDQGKIVTVLKMDKNTPMGLVSDIKQNLRKAGIRTIYYSAEKRAVK